MSYGRASSDEVLDSGVVLALVHKMGLAISPEEADVLTVLLMNQMAAFQSFDAFDLQDAVPAPIFRAGGIGGSNDE